MSPFPRAGHAALGALLPTLLIAPPLRAQHTCEPPPGQAFDFWLGDWEVQQQLLRADGSWLELPARTSVRRELDGCALIERWDGRVQFFWEGMQAPEAMAGLSVRTWDAERRVWRIWWMDSRRPVFGEPFVGRFAGGGGVFERQAADDRGALTTRIRFYDRQEQAVCWDLGVSRDGGATWTTLWKMRFARAGRTEPVGPPPCAEPAATGH